MSVIAEDLIAALDEAGGFDARLARLERVAEQLAAGMVDGRVLPGDEAAAVRAALIAHLRDQELPRQTPHRGLRVLDVLARRGLRELEPLRASLEATRAASLRPPRAPAWPELTALRALPEGAALFAPGITHVGFAAELAERGAPVPPELLELYAATDGLVLRNRTTDEVVFRLETADALAVAARDGGRVLLIASWWLRPFGHSRESIELWLADGMLSGAYLRRHPGQPDHRLRFGSRPLDVPAMLRFALSRVDAAPETERERELGIVEGLYAERSWGWYLADDDERFDLLVRAGRPAAARAHGERVAADLLEDAASCTRVGDHGAATKAERAHDAWLDRLRTLP